MTNYRVQYFENGKLQVVEASGEDLNDVKSKFRGKRNLTVCVMKDYKALYEKYSNVMNPPLLSR